jgi:hypothetical protein
MAPIDLILTVLNCPLSGNIAKYVEALKNFPIDATHRRHAQSLKGRLERRVSSAMVEGSPELSGDDDFISFEHDRAVLVRLIEKIRGIQRLCIDDDESMIIQRASELRWRKRFKIDGTPGNYRIERISAYRGLMRDNRILVDIFNFACHELLSFLADRKRGGCDRLKRCARCNNFFSRERDDERNRFCSDDCRSLHHQEQRRNDEGRAQRAAYMRTHRAVLRERRRARERAREVNRLMDAGHTREEAEGFLNDENA